MSTSDRVEMIKARCNAAFTPTELDVVDESHKHVGHAGAAGGGGHFKMRIVAPEFAGKNLLERHRMVYEAMGEAMHHEIHALSVKAYSPDEV